MPFTVSEQYNTSIMSISGKFLGSVEGAKIKATAQELRDAGKTRLVVDLSKTDFMDSSGIGVLISLLKTMNEVGGDVKLAGLHKRIRNLFLMTRLLGNVFQTYDSVEEAAHAFNPAI